MRNFKKFQSGFTLIELLVVIAIIGVLATIVTVSLNSARLKARNTRRMADLAQIKLALESYRIDNGAYPGSCNSFWWIDDNNFAGSSGYPPCATSGGLAPYFSDICKVYGPLGQGSTDGYAYTLQSDGKYKIGAKFETSAYQITPYTYGCSGQTPVSGFYEMN